MKLTRRIPNSELDTSEMSAKTQTYLRADGLLTDRPRRYKVSVRFSARGRNLSTSAMLLHLRPTSTRLSTLCPDQPGHIGPNSGV
jgi:hypothetical protein